METAERAEFSNSAIKSVAAMEKDEDEDEDEDGDGDSSASSAAAVGLVGKEGGKNALFSALLCSGHNLQGEEGINNT